MKFSQLTALLPDRQFVLFHRSYFVNLDYVSYLRSRELELSTGAVLPPCNAGWIFIDKFSNENFGRMIIS